MGEDILTTIPQPGDKKTTPSQRPIPQKVATKKPEQKKVPTQQTTIKGGTSRGMVILISSIALIIGALSATIGMYYWNTESRNKAIEKVQTEAQTTVNALQTELNTTNAKLAESEATILALTTMVDTPNITLEDDGLSVIVYDDGKKVDTITYDLPEGKASILHQTPNKVYIVVNTTGLDGKSLYKNSPTELYQYDRVAGTITKLFSEEGTSVQDITLSGEYIALFRDDIPTLKNMTTGEETSYPLPETYKEGQRGDLMFSPNGKLLAYAVTTDGPSENTHDSAVIVIDTTNESVSLIDEAPDVIYHVKSWTGNNTTDVSYYYFPY